MNIKALIFGLLAASTCLGQEPTSEQRIAALEKRVAALEAALAASQRTSPAPTERIVTEGVSPLSMTTWSYRVVRGDYGSHYEITLDLKNTGTKDIKLIEGGVVFKDLLGEKIYSIRITPDQKVAAGKSLVDKGRYDINQFIASQTRMAQMKKEDIQATLVIRKLVFTDNTIAEYGDR
jgi:hypothetical protein